LARRGRPPLERGIVPCEQATLELPNRALLDTSFVVDALLSAQGHHTACSTALFDLARAEGTFVYSELLEVELLEAVYRIALTERYGPKKWKRHRPDGRARRGVARISQETLAAWETLDGALQGERVELSSVADQVPDLMHRYGLRSYDAVHVATAFHIGTKAVYTLDRDFARVPARQLTIFTVSAKVAGMRKLRG
jgi:predicted nucleic acid-binding protein